ncbi:OmpA family protein [Aquincola sp. S2]|uniref:OmpA family protein n=1 Tax=Pseudaquabacterium terrae TaxID=2732868 RepID=A0ABX2EET5_9BURK|nr:OmpA family protein [Aquabacterium terrae]NRF67116.1 OmpA family protein [Aquabacterium terrae]
MKHTLTTGALLGSLLLAACATTPMPPPALVEARSALRQAEADPAVAALAPLELKKAVDALQRANTLFAEDRSSPAAIDSAAYIAGQQARTAMAAAQAKGNEAAIAGAQVERERIRADLRTAEAQRARAQTGVALAQAGMAREQAAVSAQRADSADQRSALAQAQATEAQQQTAQLQQRLSALQATPTERGLLVTLGDVLFETNQAAIKPAAQGSLRKLAEFLQVYPGRVILIEGHTDNVGTAATNEVLSRRRADAVNAMLAGMGVSGQRVTTVGYGEDYPVADNITDTNRALNRRVEIYIAENDQPIRTRR